MATLLQDFFVAAARGDIKFVVSLVRSGLISDLNCRDSNGWTAMMVATNYNHKDVVAFLIHSGADLEVRNSDHQATLYLAAAQGHLAIVKLLVDCSATIDRVEVDGFTPLLVASLHGHTQAVSFLAERGAALNHQTPKGNTAVHLAVFRQHIDVIKILIQRGASVLVRTSDLWTPVMMACDTANAAVLTAILELLRANGQHDTIVQVLEIPSSDGETPLILAARKGYLPVLRVLLKYGATMGGKDKTDSTALTNTVKSGHLKIARYLVEHGANIHHADLVGHTPLNVAASKGSIAIVELLLKAGANLKARSHGGFTPLHSAVYRGHCQVAQLLVKHGSKLEARTNKGYTPLLLAAQRADLQIVQHLVNQGASIDVTTRYGKTPLITSCGLNHSKTNHFLLELAVKRGLSGNLNIQELTGRTALHWTAFHGDVPTAQLLIQRGADLSISDEWGLTPLHMAFVSSQEKMIQLLVANGEVPVNDNDSFWPIAALNEMHGRPFDLGSDQRSARDQKWFIAMSSVRFVYGHPSYLQKGILCSGIWFGAPVSILRPSPPLSKPTHEEKEWWRDFRIHFSLGVMKWYPLNHPHLLKLYGACHLPGQMLLVTERVPRETLREYVRNHPHKKWKWTVLYQVALAVQYLHERDTTHARLRCDNIRVMDEGLVKLMGSELLFFQTREDPEDFRWRSPQELVRGDIELEDDIYSLGMCVIEAITGEPPYFDYDPEIHGDDLKKWVTSATPPTRSPSFSDHEWDLIMHMISFGRFHRPRISDVVREFEELAREEALDSQTGVSRVEDADALLDKVSSLLSQQDGEISVKLHYQAFKRLEHLRAIHLSAANASERAEDGFRMVLTRFANHLTQYRMDIDTQVKRFSDRHLEGNMRLYEAAVALQFLHYKGVLHCDLKCDNILIGADGKTRLADFGLSSVGENVSDKVTQAVRWSAPEILRGEAASAASDVYGLAMCIVEAVTDKHPWHKLNKYQVMNAVKDGLPMERPPMFRDAQWELVEQMTQRDASTRLPLNQAVEAMRRFAQEEAAGKYATAEAEAEPEPESKRGVAERRQGAEYVGVLQTFPREQRFRQSQLIRYYMVSTVSHS